MRSFVDIAQLLTSDKNIALSHELKADMCAFISDCKIEPVNLKQIGIAGTTMTKILEVMERTYRLDFAD